MNGNSTENISISYQTTEETVNVVNSLGDQINDHFDNFGRSVLYVVGAGGNVGAMANSFRDQYDALKPTLDNIVSLVHQFAEKLNTASEMEREFDARKSQEAENLNGN